MFICLSILKIFLNSLFTIQDSFFKPKFNLHMNVMLCDVMEKKEFSKQKTLKDYLVKNEDLETQQHHSIGKRELIFKNLLDTEKRKQTKK